MTSFKEEFIKIKEEYYSQPNDKLIERISNPLIKTIIFGAGAVGRMVALTIADKATNFIGFCDNNKTGFFNEFNKPIITPAQLKKDFLNAIVIIAAGDKNIIDLIYQQLLNMKINPLNIFIRYSGYDLYDIKDFKNNHYDGYEWAYNYFKDEESKRIILEWIKQHLFYYEASHEPLQNQYFDPSIGLTDAEVFVDGGCYIGDTSMEFIKRVGGKYKKIIGFEPDKQNYKIALKNLKIYKNICVVSKGLYNENTKLTFTDSIGGSSQVVKNGTVLIKTTSLDSFLFTKNEPPPTYIKLDIEGVEKQAIMGMEKTIKNYKPKLAICVYHKIEDIYQISQMISELNKYKMFLKNYSPGLTDVVLYAV